MKKILFEAYVEYGPKGYKVYRGRGDLENTNRGSMYNYSNEVVPATQNDKALIDYVYNILKKKGLLKGITKKEDTRTMDIQFNGNIAKVNFDDGGTIDIPIKKSASIMTEAESIALKGANKNLFGGAEGRHLGVEFVPIDQVNNDNPYGVKSVWAVGTRYEDRVRINSYTELEDYQRDAIRAVFNYLKAATSKKGNGTMLDYVNKKEDWKTVDVVFKGDGSADVQFDGIGGVRRIDYSGFSKMKGWNPNLSKKENQENFRNAKKSVYTEDVNYFPY